MSGPPRFVGLLLAASVLCACAPPAVASDSGTRSTLGAACSASVEAAAHAAIGGQETASGRVGYRAQDVVVDPILRRLWVRVADCSDSRRPLTLVAIAAPLAGAAGPGVASSAVYPTSAVAASVPLLIHRGDVVDVIVQSATMHMVLRGKATSEAAANTEVDVQLDGDARTNETPRHIRGIAIAEHRVEVHL